MGPDASNSRSAAAILTRVVTGATFGALIACAALAVATILKPAILIDFDTDLPRQVGTGFYPVERGPEETFVWTGPLATLTLRGVDRDVPWRCTLRLRSGRPPDQPQPQVTVGVDGRTAGTYSPSPGYQDIGVDVPVSRNAALLVSIGTTPTFVPGPGDTRELGVQLDHVICAPAAGSRVLPSRAALSATATAGAAFGIVFAVLAPTLPPAFAASILLSSLLALVLTTGFAAYLRGYLEWIGPVALWATAPVLVFALARAWLARAIRPATAFVLSFSAAVLFIKTLALLHPSKDVVDAVFHAHRLGAVLGGNYYFTQPMPGGVQFPYAIGLYVTAVPWAELIRDHVALLRIVVLVFEAAAALLLYAVVTRSWQDQWTGALSVALYHLAPLPYVVIGNANLTYAFGQSVGVMAVAAAVVLPFRKRPVFSTGVLSMVAALAFLSHVGVFPVLALTLFALACLYAWRGGDDLRTASRAVFAATALAAVIAIGSYYAHFPEVYRTLNRVSSPVSQPQANTATTAAAPLTLGGRVTRAATLGVRAYGLPLVALALIGSGIAWRRPRTAATLALAAIGFSFVVFLLFRTVAPVDARLQRYADEFIDRLYYASLPAVAILAAAALTWGWRRGSAWRVATAVIAAAAVVIGFQQWAAWIR